MDAVWPYLAAIIPTLVVATLFYFIVKGMIEGDRRERLAQSRFEAEQDRRRAAGDAPFTSETTPPTTPGAGSGAAAESASGTSAGESVDKSAENPPRKTDGT